MTKGRKMMKWAKKTNGDIEALGFRGDFLLWKDGRKWRGRYRSKDERRHFFIAPQGKLAEMKRLCESNHYWKQTKERVSAPGRRGYAD